MSQPLAEQEVAEANAYLFRFNKAYRLYTMFLSISVVSGLIGVPLLLLQAWLTSSAPLLQVLFVSSAIVAVSIAVAVAWRYQSSRLFEEVRLRALKLQRAGLVVYKKPAFLVDVLSASTETPEGASVLNFETVSIYELHDHFH